MAFSNSDFRKHIRSLSFGEYNNKFKEASDNTETIKLPIDINNYIMNKIISGLRELYGRKIIFIIKLEINESKFSFIYKVFGDVVYAIEMEVINKVSGEIIITKNRLKDNKIERKNNIYSKINDLFESDILIKMLCDKLIML